MWLTGYTYLDDTLQLLMFRRAALHLWSAQQELGFAGWIRTYRWFLLWLRWNGPTCRGVWCGLFWHFYTLWCWGWASIFEAPWFKNMINFPEKIKLILSHRVSLMSIILPGSTSVTLKPLHSHNNNLSLKIALKWASNVCTGCLIWNSGSRVC